MARSGRQASAFRTRADVDTFCRLERCLRGLAEERDAAGLEADLPSICDCDWLEDLRQDVLCRIARLHEKRGDSAAALRCYARCSDRGARIRAARLHERGRDWQAAREICLAALHSPASAPRPMRSSVTRGIA
jgi:hypothetical protein